MGSYDVQSVTGSPSTFGAGSTSKSTSMDMTAFLTLFTTQLQNQDPSNPLESYELAAQLAQFSTVERLTAISDNLEQMESYLLSMNNSMMVQMLGKEITGQSDTLQLKDGQVTKADYELSADAEVSIRIYDDQGQLVRTMAMGAQEAGSQEVSWDGCDDSGEALEDGLYRFEVEAVDADGNSVATLSTVTGTCASVHMENGLVYLILDSADGVAITPSSVIEVTEPGLTA